MAWIELVIAGGLEVFWSTFMKLSEGFFISVCSRIKAGLTFPHPATCGSFPL